MSSGSTLNSNRSWRLPARLAMRFRVGAAAVIALMMAAGVSSCGSDPPASPSPPPGGIPNPQPPPVPVTAVLVGAGDIAVCGSGLANAEATARLIDGIEGTVFTTGDHALGEGTRDQFNNCYAPTWGRHKGRTRPIPGNHDVQSEGGAPYFDFFGGTAGPPGLGYYSYDAGSWHIVALNSTLSMSSGSAQAQWLRQDLQAHPSACTLAYWHHPLVSSSVNGNNPQVRDVWQILYEAGVEVVLNGHDHHFERFAPQDPSGRPDGVRGIRQFTVGTGGYTLYGVVQRQPNSEVQASVHGVLKLTLRPGAYDWQFIPVPGTTFADSGSGNCH